MGIMVVDRKFLGEIGALDGGMKVYGGENVELGVRVRSNNIMHHSFFFTRFCEHLIFLTTLFSVVIK